MHKQAVDAESCILVPSRKMTRLEHARQSILKLLTKPVNQNCPEFVMLNKKAIFEKVDGKMLNNIKGFGNKGC